MRKKLLSVILTLALTLAYTGCAAKTDGVKKTADEAKTADGTDYSEKIFGKDVIEINISASEEDWAYLMENATSKPYISADVEIDGVAFKNVGIKTKGNTTLTQVAATDSDRFSLKINFDKYVDKQDCYGLDSLVLNNLYGDSTYLKEYMSYALFDYMEVPSSLSTFANITVNGEHYGFFIALEDVDESFLERNYSTDYSGQAYKPEGLDMEGNGGNMGGGNFPEMSLDITKIFTLTDSEGNAVEWSSVLPEGFDTAAISSVTFSDGSTAEFNIGELRNADITDIKSLTDKNGLTADISTYTISTSANMPQGGGMQGPGAQAGSNTKPTGNGEPPQLPNNQNGTTPGQGENNPGMQNPGVAMNGMDGGALGVDLKYSDDEISSYSNIFDNAITKAEETDEKRLIKTLKAISEGEQLENYIDIDEVLRYAAVNVFLVNLDSYFSNMGHNYCLYEDGGKLSMLPWDYNLSFGTFNSADATDAVNYAIDTIFSGVSLNDRPIIGKLLNNEEYLKRYHEYLSELAEYVSSGEFSQKVDAVVSSIDSYVKNDTGSFTSYEAFKTGVETLKSFAALRAESVSGQLNGTIPSTEQGQQGSSALVDASELKLSDLGTMGGNGRQGGNGGFGAVPTPRQQSTGPNGNPAPATAPGGSGN